MASFQSHDVPCGARTLQILAAGIGDPELTDGADPDRIPYWSTLWPSALATVRWITQRGSWSGQPVLELGCGAGVAGIAAALAGAEVVQTDLFPAAVSLARRNAAANGAAGIRHLAADWHHWPLTRRWPVLLASDVAYERASHPALLAVLERSLAPNGTAYFADPGRAMSRDFFRRAAADSWAVTEQPISDSEIGIRLFTLRRRERS